MCVIVCKLRKYSIIIPGELRLIDIFGVTLVH